MTRSTRREFCAALAAAPASAAAARRPNVLYILVDQWRAQAFGYAGDKNARTAAIDRLAGQSVSFPNAVSGCAVCSPYRGSLMTGQFPLTSGVFINDVVFAPKGETLAQSFASAGYRTGYIGKWHLSGSPGGKNERRLDFTPRSQRFGFDYWKALDCSHNYNKSPYYEGDDPTMKIWPGYDAIAQTGAACEFIAKHAGANDPYFLVVSFGPPHSPYGTAPENYKALYNDRPVEMRPNVPASVRERALEDIRGYYAHVAALDDCVKRLVEAVDRSGAAEDTILVFTSDHGDMLGSQGLQAKQHPWDESVRVPLLVRYPRRTGLKGRSVTQPINTPDLMPTLLGLAGLRVPDSVQGSDLSGLITGAKKSDPEAGALLNLAATFTVARGCGFAEYRGMRTATHTYVRSVHGPWLLYDNVKDPYQMHNLVDKPEHKDVQAKLDRAVDAALRRANDDFLPGQRYLENAGLTHYREANAPVRGCRSPWGDWGPTMK